MVITEKLINGINRWLTKEDEPPEMPMCDFSRLSYEIRPCDVLLVEGRSRVSYVIKTITQSIWTHTALYIGRLHDIEDETLREHIHSHYDGDPRDQLIIEALLGEGTIITPLSKYQHDHLRICRPRGLAREDAQKIIHFSAYHLGMDYDLRQLLDLARFLLPYSIVPRRWRSSLFEHHAGGVTRTVCSTMIASAFSSVHYPVLPVVQRDEDGGLHFYKRNTRLYTPSDFDYSPYFDIVKYPVLGLDDLSVYRQLPWDTEGLVCNSPNDCYIPPEQPHLPFGLPKAKVVVDDNPDNDSSEAHSETTLSQQPKA